MGRKKKLETGIKSLEEQNGIHKDKIETEKGKHNPNEELIDYWEKERRKFIRDIDRKKEQADRKKGKR